MNQIARARIRWVVPHSAFISLAGCLFFMISLFAQANPAWKAEWPRTDFSKHSVKLEEIFSGGPPKDGIPAIDRPRFVSTQEAARWLHPREPVIVIEIRGEARAYPLQILMFHEIVNDTIAGVPVAVTFCPLCNASIVFDRRVQGKILDFGATGKLRKSDLVMYDRQTESWWQQFTGKGIVGHFNNATLRPLPAAITAYSDFRSTHPQGKVLSRDTGFVRPYGRNPYLGYDRIGDQPFLFHDPVDPRLPAMERVIGITRDGRTRIYPLSTLTRQPVINDQIGREPVVIMSRSGMLSVLDAENIQDSREIQAATAYSRHFSGKTLTFELRSGQITDKETGSQWNIYGAAVSGTMKGARLTPVDAGVHFAFAWLAFHPDSEIYGTGNKPHSK